VSGNSGLIANVHRVRAVIPQEIRKAVKANGEAQRGETEAACPKDTGYMASKTRVEFSPEGLTFDVGYFEEDFPEVFYPQLVIHGTSRMAANDFIFQVHEGRRAQNTKAVGDAVRRGFRGLRA
jgi:hypothetical protein